MHSLFCLWWNFECCWLHYQLLFSMLRVYAMPVCIPFYQIVSSIPFFTQHCNFIRWWTLSKLSKFPFHTKRSWCYKMFRLFFAHLSRRLEWAIVIAHRPSSVRPSVRPSVVRRPSGVNFHIFDFSSETAERNSTKLDRKQDLNALYQVFVFRADPKNKMAALASDWLRHFRLLLWNRWTEFNKTWQEARYQSPLPSLCFSGRSEKQDGRPGLWLADTFSTSPLKPLNGIQRNLTGSKISTPSTKFVFFGQSEKQNGRPDLWFAKTFSTSPLKPLNRIQRNLTGSKISTPSTKFVFFRPIRKTRWPLWHLIGRDIFDFSSETAERNSTKLDRKQDLKALYQVCVFRADPKNKMAALASDWLRHIRLLLWNGWTEFNDTWQEARSQRPLPSLCSSGRSEKQDGRPSLWLAETFSTSL